MSLERLAGPFQIVNIDTGDALTDIFRVLWVDGVGMLISDSSFDFLLQLDGAASPFALTPSGLYDYLPSVSSGDRWYSILLNGADECTLERVMHVRGAVVYSPAVGGAIRVGTNRFIRHIATGSRVQGSLDGSAWVDELTVGAFGSHGGYYSWARSSNQVWIANSNGRIFLYDHVTHELASPVWRIGETTCIGLFYSKKHDVFVSITANAGVFEISTWAHTAVPASIAAPTASAAPTAGRSVTLTTRVLGSEGEPCEGEVVAWTQAGDGLLERPATETDEQGYATNRLLIPLSAAGPSLDVSVEVVTP